MQDGPCAQPSLSTMPRTDGNSGERGDESQVKGKQLYILWIRILLACPIYL